MSLQVNKSRYTKKNTELTHEYPEISTENTLKVTANPIMTL